MENRKLESTWNFKMTKFISISFLLFLLSCGDHISTQILLPPDKKDINEIIEAVIRQDSLPFVKKPVVDSNSIPLLKNLRKVRVILTDTTSEVPPPVDHTTVSVFDLLNSLVGNQKFFNRADSSYFFFQNDTVKDFSIEKTILDKLSVNTTLSEKQGMDSPNKFSPYYDLTIPIFSADNTRAYVEWTTNCMGCGGATSFYLQKTDNKWKVVGWRKLWRN